MLAEGQVAAVIVAAGKSTRMGFDKLFHKIEGTEVLRKSVAALDAHPAIDSIVVVAGSNIAQVHGIFKNSPTAKPLVIVEGGSTRLASVISGVAACPNASLVAIHDGARPFVSAEVITRVVEAAALEGAAAPALPVVDTVKRVKDGLVVDTVSREGLMTVQTPQVFNRTAFVRALAKLPKADAAAITDDCMVMELAGFPVRLVAGDKANRKITTPEDLEEGGAKPLSYRPAVGYGYDVHRLVEGRRLVLGGVDIDFEKGLLGHSDADVLYHAVSDALLGAAAMGDIGQHFPDTDPAFLGADSGTLLAAVAHLLREAGCRPLNIDATLVCQAPRLAPHLPTMRENIARHVGLELSSVSVKATTEEGLGFTGTGEGISAHATVMIERPLPVASR